MVRQIPSRLTSVVDRSFDWAVGVLQLDNGSAVGGFSEKVQRSSNHATLGGSITCVTEWSTHGMSGYDCSWVAHFFGYMSERADNYGNRRDAFSLCSSGYVPDRHVTHGSDGYQKEGLDSGRLPSGDPLIEFLAEATLRTNADEGVGG